MSTATAEQRATAVDQAIREISHIATLPEVTLKIIELVEDPSSTAQDLHNVISSDPALCSRILKVVNSSFYGLPGQIASINRAIVLLGLNAVKNIAIAASLAKLFRGGDVTPAFNAKDLWTHCNAVGTAAKVIADMLRIGNSDEAYLAGLTHDIGIMVMMQYDRSKLAEVIDMTGADHEGMPANDMLDIELRVFGATHEDFGQALCKKWKFPDVFTHVTGRHHHPLEMPSDARKVPCVIYVADRVAARLGHGFRLDLPTNDIDPAVLEHLNMTEHQVEEVMNKVQEHMEAEGALPL